MCSKGVEINSTQNCQVLKCLTCNRYGWNNKKPSGPLTYILHVANIFKGLKYRAANQERMRTGG